MDTETKRNLIIAAIFLTGLLVAHGGERRSWFGVVAGAILLGCCFVVTLLCLP